MQTALLHELNCFRCYFARKGLRQSQMVVFRFSLKAEFYGMISCHDIVWLDVPVEFSKRLGAGTQAYMLGTVGIFDMEQGVGSGVCSNVNEHLALVVN